MSILTYFSVKFNITLLVAPPLIVAFIELTNDHCKFRQRSKILLFLFIVVAILGFIFRIGFNEYLGLPLWLCTIFLLISLFIGLEIFNMYFPLVAAIAVLPILLTSNILSISNCYRMLYVYNYCYDFLEKKNVLLTFLRIKINLLKK